MLSPIYVVFFSFLRHIFTYFFIFMPAIYFEVRKNFKTLLLKAEFCGCCMSECQNQVLFYDLVYEVFDFGVDYLVVGVKKVLCVEDCELFFGVDGHHKACGSVPAELAY